MKKVFIFYVLLLFSGVACACGSDAQRESMAKRLYADIGMRKFVCGRDSCSMQDFEEGLQFNQYDESFRGRDLLVCLVESILNSANSYAGVFVEKASEFEFKFISYGTGVKAGVGKNGALMILEYSVSDHGNCDYSMNKYLWNGVDFVFIGSVSLRN
ncbi:hypothetical protein [Burkholderia sp. F1]|uniref:hypothetical protein n=1 Tax=Burkholderia sp. F1 TaxID=3366817 RepID=UPI003D759038